MKKFLALLLSALSVTVLLASCNNSVKAIDVEQAADTLYQNLTYDDELNPLDQNMLYTTYSDLKEEDVVKAKVYVSSSATAEEIAVFEAKDAEAAGRIKSVMDGRVAEQTDIYADYAPDEVQRLSKAVVRQKGNYVVLLVAKDADKAAQEVDNLFK